MMPSHIAGDKRFQDPAWLTLPFSLYQQAYSVVEAWGEAASALTDPWVAPEARPRAAFQAHQWLDLFSPTNAPWSNPQVLEARMVLGLLALLQVRRW